MADLDLRVDYQDDILDLSVNTKRKYNIIENEDGTKSLEDVSVYTQKGDSLGAVDVNKTNQAVLDLNKSLTLDFSNASSDVQDINTLLQNLLEKFYPQGTLYDNGNQFVTLTGGWEDYPLPWAEGYTSKPAIFSESVIILDCNESQKSVSVTTKKAIDLTNFTQLRVEYVQNVSNHSSPYILIKNNKSEYVKLNPVKGIYMDAGTSVGVLDISDLSGSYFPVIHVDNLRAITVKKVQLL